MYDREPGTVKYFFNKGSVEYFIVTYNFPIKRYITPAISVIVVNSIMPQKISLFVKKKSINM